MPSTAVDQEKLKGQIQAALKNELMGAMMKEFMEQMKPFLKNLSEEVRTQLPTTDGGPASRAQMMGYQATMTQAPPNVESASRPSSFCLPVGFRGPADLA